MGTPAKVLAAGDVRRLQARVGRGRFALRNRVIVMLSFRAGLRACEIAGLDWKMVLGADGKIGGYLMIGNAIAKNGRGRRLVVELAAMDAVMGNERSLGHVPVDVSAQKKGWDIESLDNTTGSLRLIEVKGRHADARDVIITKNEILASLNAPDAFHLALVSVSNGYAQQPIYVQRFFRRELGFAETAVVFNLNDLLSLAHAAN